MRLESYSIFGSGSDYLEFKIEISDAPSDGQGYQKRKVHTFLGKHFRRVYGGCYHKFVVTFSHFVLRDGRLSLWGRLFLS